MVRKIVPLKGASLKRCARVLREDKIAGYEFSHSNILELRACFAENILRNDRTKRRNGRNYGTTMSAISAAGISGRN